MQIDMLILYRAPQALDKDIISPGSLAIHADPDIVIGQVVGKRQTGELATLISIHDLRWSVLLHRFLQGVQTEASIHRH